MDKKQITIILVLVALCAVILIFPLMTIHDSEFGGADGAALSGASFPMSFCAMSAKRLISSGLDSTALSRSSSSLIFRFRAGRAFPQGLLR